MRERERVDPRTLLLLGLWLCAAAIGADAHGILECRGPEGERIFVDRAQCPASSTLVEARKLVAPMPTASTPTVDAPERGSARRAAASHKGSSRGSAQRTARSSPAESFRCEQGSRVWYQHQPCAGGDSTPKEKGAKSAKASLRQTRISRSEACREIHRAAAVLRPGSHRDQRVEPYQRATRGDPCR